jgi:hypothetical protein
MFQFPCVLRPSLINVLTSGNSISNGNSNGNSNGSASDSDSDSRRDANDPPNENGPSVSGQGRDDNNNNNEYDDEHHSSFFFSIVNSRNRNNHNEKEEDENESDDDSDDIANGSAMDVGNNSVVLAVQNQQPQQHQNQHFFRTPSQQRQKHNQHQHQQQKVCNLINCRQTSQQQPQPEPQPDVQVQKRRDIFARINSGFALRIRESTNPPPSVLKIDPITGALLLPTYKTVPRDICPLLRHSWSQNWSEVIQIVSKEPCRTLHKTDHYNRTALHLVTFTHTPCPLSVVKALLFANRHMVLMQDKNWYTPLHLVAFFARGQGCSSSSRDDDDEEETTLISMLCDTAIMVERELGLQQQDVVATTAMAAAAATVGATIPRSYGTSPLLLAAKRNAPITTIKALLKTRSHTHWIAPTTGGEPYWDINTIPAEDYSSPLEVLIRDRISEYLRPELLLLHSSVPTIATAATATATSADGVTILIDDGGGGGGDSENESDNHHHHHDIATTRYYTLSPIANRMRQIAVERLAMGTQYGNDFYSRLSNPIEDINEPVVRTCDQCGTDDDDDDDDDGNGGRKVRSHNDNDRPKLNDEAIADNDDDEKTIQCLQLWEKCIELLVGYTPLLQVDKETDCPYGLLHAVTCCKVPIPSLVQVVLILFPEQVVLRDEKGMIPLHHVLCANHKYATPTLLEILLSGVTSSKNPLEQDSSLSTSSLSSLSFVSLLRSTALIPFPPAIDVDCCDFIGEIYYYDYDDNNGSGGDGGGGTGIVPTTSTTATTTTATVGPTPLSYALTKGLCMEFIINRLLEADSDSSLSTMDPSTQLYPFGLAALLCHCDCEQHQQHQQPEEQILLWSSSAAVAADCNNVEKKNDDDDENHNNKNNSEWTSTTTTSIRSGTRNHHRTYYYKLDDIYRLLMSHPQILSHFCT